VDDLVDKEMVHLLKACSQFRVPSLDDLAERMVSFGPLTRTKVLVLDMDETLIHAKFLTSAEQEKNDDGDFIVSIASKQGNDQIKISVKMRPYLDNCLEHLAKFYEIAVFTAGE
jgi:TFIIF-interacting CTD phosphatase-like protein